MAPFTFRLQPLMKLREADRDRCRELLADAYRADQLLQERQEAVRQELGQNQQRVRRQSQPGQLHVDGLLDSHRYELLLHAQIRQLAEQRKQVAVEIERRRQALVEADRELKMLEKLRDRHQAAYRADQEKLATRELDEVAIRRQHDRQGDIRK